MTSMHGTDTGTLVHRTDTSPPVAATATPAGPAATSSSLVRSRVLFELAAQREAQKSLLEAVLAERPAIAEQLALIFSIACSRGEAAVGAMRMSRAAFRHFMDRFGITTATPFHEFEASTRKLVLRERGAAKHTTQVHGQTGATSSTGGGGPRRSVSTQSRRGTTILGAGESTTSNSPVGRQRASSKAGLRHAPPVVVQDLVSVVPLVRVSEDAVDALYDYGVGHVDVLIAADEAAALRRRHGRSLPVPATGASTDMVAETAEAVKTHAATALLNIDLFSALCVDIARRMIPSDSYPPHSKVHLHVQILEEIFMGPLGRGFVRANAVRRRAIDEFNVPPSAKEVLRGEALDVLAHAYASATNPAMIQRTAAEVDDVMRSEFFAAMYAGDIPLEYEALLALLQHVGIDAVQVGADALYRLFQRYDTQLVQGRATIDFHSFVLVLMHVCAATVLEGQQLEVPTLASRLVRLLDTKFAPHFPIDRSLYFVNESEGIERVVKPMSAIHTLNSGIPGKDASFITIDSIRPAAAARGTCMYVFGTHYPVRSTGFSTKCPLYVRLGRVGGTEDEHLNPRIVDDGVIFARGSCSSTTMATFDVPYYPATADTRTDTLVLSSEKIVKGDLDRPFESETEEDLSKTNTARDGGQQQATVASSNSAAPTTAVAVAVPASTPRPVGTGEEQPNVSTEASADGHPLDGTSTVGAPEAVGAPAPSAAPAARAGGRQHKDLLRYEELYDYVILVETTTTVPVFISVDRLSWTLRDDITFDFKDTLLKVTVPYTLVKHLRQVFAAFGVRGPDYEEDDELRAGKLYIGLQQWVAICKAFPVPCPGNERETGDLDGAMERHKLFFEVARPRSDFTDLHAPVADFNDLLKLVFRYFCAAMGVSTRVLEPIVKAFEHATEISITHRKDFYRRKIAFWTPSLEQDPSKAPISSEVITAQSRSQAYVTNVQLTGVANIAASYLSEEARTSGSTCINCGCCPTLRDSNPVFALKWEGATAADNADSNESTAVMGSQHVLGAIEEFSVPNAVAAASITSVDALNTSFGGKRSTSLRRLLSNSSLGASPTGSSPPGALTPTAAAATGPTSAPILTPQQKIATAVSGAMKILSKKRKLKPVEAAVADQDLQRTIFQVLAKVMETMAPDDAAEAVEADTYAAMPAKQALTMGDRGRLCFLSALFDRQLTLHNEVVAEGEAYFQRAVHAAKVAGRQMSLHNLVLQRSMEAIASTLDRLDSLVEDTFSTAADERRARVAGEIRNSESLWATTNVLFRGLRKCVLFISDLTRPFLSEDAADGLVLSDAAAFSDQFRQQLLDNAADFEASLRARATHVSTGPPEETTESKRHSQLLRAAMDPEGTADGDADGDEGGTGRDGVGTPQSMRRMQSGIFNPLTRSRGDPRALENLRKELTEEFERQKEELEVSLQRGFDEQLRELDNTLSARHKEAVHVMHRLLQYTQEECIIPNEVAMPCFRVLGDNGLNLKRVTFGSGGVKREADVESVSSSCAGEPVDVSVQTTEYDLPSVKAMESTLAMRGVTNASRLALTGAILREAFEVGKRALGRHATNPIMFDEFSKMLRLEMQFTMNPRFAERIRLPREGELDANDACVSTVLTMAEFADAEKYAGIELKLSTLERLYGMVEHGHKGAASKAATATGKGAATTSTTAAAAAGKGANTGKKGAGTGTAAAGRAPLLSPRGVRDPESVAKLPRPASYFDAVDPKKQPLLAGDMYFAQLQQRMIRRAARMDAQFMYRLHGALYDTACEVQTTQHFAHAEDLREVAVQTEPSVADVAVEARPQVRNVGCFALLLDAPLPTIGDFSVTIPGKDNLAASGRSGGGGGGPKGKKSGRRGQRKGPGRRSDGRGSVGSGFSSEDDSGALSGQSSPSASARGSPASTSLAVPGGRAIGAALAAGKAPPGAGSGTEPSIAKTPVDAYAHIQASKAAAKALQSGASLRTADGINASLDQLGKRHTRKVSASVDGASSVASGDSRSRFAQRQQARSAISADAESLPPPTTDMVPIIAPDADGGTFITSGDALSSTFGGYGPHTPPLDTSHRSSNDNEPRSYLRASDRDATGRVRRPPREGRDEDSGSGSDSFDSDASSTDSAGSDFYNVPPMHDDDPGDAPTDGTRTKDIVTGDTHQNTFQTTDDPLGLSDAVLAEAAALAAVQQQRSEASLAKAATGVFLSDIEERARRRRQLRRERTEAALAAAAAEAQQKRLGGDAEDPAVAVQAARSQVGWDVDGTKPNGPDGNHQKSGRKPQVVPPKSLAGAHRGGPHTVQPQDLAALQSSMSVSRVQGPVTAKDLATQQASPPQPGDITSIPAMTNLSPAGAIARLPSPQSGPLGPYPQHSPFASSLGIISSSSLRSPLGEHAVIGSSPASLSHHSNGWGLPDSDEVHGQRPAMSTQRTLALEHLIRSPRSLESSARGASPVPTTARTATTTQGQSPRDGAATSTDRGPDPRPRRGRDSPTHAGHGPIDTFDDAAETSPRGHDQEFSRAGTNTASVQQTSAAAHSPQAHASSSPSGAHARTTNANAATTSVPLSTFAPPNTGGIELKAPSAHPGSLRWHATAALSPSQSQHWTAVPAHEHQINLPPGHVAPAALAAGRRLVSGASSSDDGRGAESDDIGGALVPRAGRRGRSQDATASHHSDDDPARSADGRRRSQRRQHSAASSASTSASSADALYYYFAEEVVNESEEWIEVRVPAGGAGAGPVTDHPLSVEPLSVGAGAGRDGDVVETVPLCVQYVVRQFVKRGKYARRYANHKRQRGSLLRYSDGRLIQPPSRRVTVTHTAGTEGSEGGEGVSTIIAIGTHVGPAVEPRLSLSSGDGQDDPLRTSGAVVLPAAIQTTNTGTVAPAVPLSNTVDHRGRAAGKGATLLAAQPESGAGPAAARAPPAKAAEMRSKALAAALFRGPVAGGDLPSSAAESAATHHPMPNFSYHHHNARGSSNVDTNSDALNAAALAAHNAALLSGGSESLSSQPTTGEVSHRSAPKDLQESARLFQFSRSRRGTVEHRRFGGRDSPQSPGLGDDDLFGGGSSLEAPPAGEGGVGGGGTTEATASKTSLQYGKALWHKRLEERRRQQQEQQQQRGSSGTPTDGHADEDDPMLMDSTVGGEGLPPQSPTNDPRKTQEKKRRGNDAEGDDDDDEILLTRGEFAEIKGKLMRAHQLCSERDLVRQHMLPLLTAFGDAGLVARFKREKSSAGLYDIAELLERELRRVFAERQQHAQERAHAALHSAPPSLRVPVLPPQPQGALSGPPLSGFQQPRHHEARATLHSRSMGGDSSDHAVAPSAMTTDDPLNTTGSLNLTVNTASVLTPLLTAATDGPVALFADDAAAFPPSAADLHRRCKDLWLQYFDRDETPPAAAIRTAGDGATAEDPPPLHHPSTGIDVVLRAKSPGDGSMVAEEALVAPVPDSLRTAMASDWRLCARHVGLQLVFSSLRPAASPRLSPPVGSDVSPSLANMLRACRSLVSAAVDAIQQHESMPAAGGGQERPWITEDGTAASELPSATLQRLKAALRALSAQSSEASPAGAVDEGTHQRLSEAAVLAVPVPAKPTSNQLPPQSPMVSGPFLEVNFQLNSMMALLDPRLGSPPIAAAGSQEALNAWRQRILDHLLGRLEQTLREDQPASEAETKGGPSRWLGVEKAHRAAMAALIALPALTVEQQRAVFFFQQRLTAFILCSIAGDTGRFVAMARALGAAAATAGTEAAAGSFILESLFSEHARTELMRCLQGDQEGPSQGRRSPSLPPWAWRVLGFDQAEYEILSAFADNNNPSSLDAAASARLHLLRDIAEVTVGPVKSTSGVAACLTPLQWLAAARRFLTTAVLRRRPPPPPAAARGQKNGEEGERRASPQATTPINGPPRSVVIEGAERAAGAVPDATDLFPALSHCPLSWLQQKPILRLRHVAGGHTTGGRTPNGRSDGPRVFSLMQRRPLALTPQPRAPPPLSVAPHHQAPPFPTAPPVHLPAHAVALMEVFENESGPPLPLSADEEAEIRRLRTKGLSAWAPSVVPPALARRWLALELRHAACVAPNASTSSTAGSVPVSETFAGRVAVIVGRVTTNPPGDLRTAAAPLALATALAHLTVAETREVVQLLHGIAVRGGHLPALPNTSPLPSLLFTADKAA